MSDIEIYQSDDGETRIEVRFEEETIWLSQKQIASVFGTEVPAVNKHIKNILKSGELLRNSTVSKMEIVQTEGTRQVKRTVEAYSLDMVISVGYRVNSTRATQFRIWATQRLKDYLVQGYAINEKRLAQKQQEVQHLKDGIRILSRAIEEKAEETNYDWLDLYAVGLRLLDDYDHEALDKIGTTQKDVTYPNYADYMELVDDMSAEFASDVFGQERGIGFRSAIDQIQQCFGGKELYPTFEEKAATLLYLIVKNHAFTDGNKRIAAACFLMFLDRNGKLPSDPALLIISNEALASLTLFVAASKPDEMETVKQLIISILNRNSSLSWAGARGKK